MKHENQGIQNDQIQVWDLAKVHTAVPESYLVLLYMNIPQSNGWLSQEIHNANILLEKMAQVLAPSSNSPPPPLLPIHLPLPPPLLPIHLINRAV